jgi:hypothetical protein
MDPDSPSGPLLTIDRPPQLEAEQDLAYAPQDIEELLSPASTFSLAPASKPKYLPSRTRAHPASIFGLRELATCILLVFATAQFINHTPPRARNVPLWDFTTVFSASRVWLHGGNPYDMQQVFHAYAQSNPAPPLAKPDPELLTTWGSFQPPSTLLLLAPFALLNAGPAALAWLALNLLCVSLLFPALFSLADIRDIRSRWLLIAATLASAPVQHALDLGQISVVAATLVILALWALSRDRRFLAGLLLGLAASIKLPLAAPFAVYFLLTGEIRLCASTAAVAALTCAAGALQLNAHGIPWLTDLHRNVVQGFAPGGINDPRLGGAWRHALINVGALFFTVLDNATIVTTLTYSLVAALIAAFVRGILRTRNPATDLLCLSIVAAISMLPMYHRLYDAILLALPLAWAVARLDDDRHHLAHLTLAVLATFLIPCELLLSITLRIPSMHRIIDTRAGQAFLVNQYCWQTLIAAAWLLYVFHRTRNTRHATDLHSAAREPSDQQWSARARPTSPFNH